MVRDLPFGILVQAVWPLLAYAVSVPAMALRWRAVLEGVGGRRLPLGPLILASLASSFVNNVTAGPGGDAFRVVALVRLRFTSASRATAAAIYERLSEVPAIIAMFAVAFVVFGDAPLAFLLRITRLPTGVAAAIAALPVAAALWIGRSSIRRAMQRLRDRGGLDAIRIDPAAIVISAGWSMVIWTLDLLRLWLIGRMFHAHLSVTHVTALSTIAIVGGWAPTIGGLGAIEAGLVGGLLALGVPGTTAVGITAVERGISYGIATLAGAGAMMALGGRELWTAMRARTGVAS